MKSRYIVLMFFLGGGVAHARDLQQYISVEWSPGQKRMDIYLWSLLHGDSAGAIIPQLPTLVFLWSYHDFLHSLVHDNCCACPWTGSYYFLSTHLAK
jgi:hypothetical protein